MGQPKMKYMYNHVLEIALIAQDEVKKLCIPYEHIPKNVEISNFEQLPKHILRVFPSLGGVNSILWG